MPFGRTVDAQIAKLQIFLETRPKFRMCLHSWRLLAYNGAFSLTVVFGSCFLDIFETPVTVTPQQEFSKTLNSSAKFCALEML